MLIQRSVASYPLKQEICQFVTSLIQILDGSWWVYHRLLMSPEIDDVTKFCLVKADENNVMIH